MELPLEHLPRIRQNGSPKYLQDQHGELNPTLAVQSRGEASSDVWFASLGKGEPDNSRSKTRKSAVVAHS